MMEVVAPRKMVACVKGCMGLGVTIVDELTVEALAPRSWSVLALIGSKQCGCDRFKRLA